MGSTLTDAQKRVLATTADQRRREYEQEVKRDIDNLLAIIQAKEQAVVISREQIPENSSK